MRLKPLHLFLFTLVLAVSACSRAPKAPTGQVAANVGGREITVRQLSAEISSLPPVAPAAQKAQQRGVLNFIIQRTILADAARKQGLDKDPNFILMSERATDALLVQQLQAKIAAGVPPPSPEEIAQFQSGNPDIFAQRKIFDVEQIHFAQQADPNFVKKLQPFKTLEDVANFLTQNNISFQRGQGTIDAVTQNPKLVTAIVALPPQEVFILSAGNQVVVNVVRSMHIQPLTGDTATKYASNYLKAQHTQDAVRKQLGALLASGQRGVEVSKDYQAPPKPAGAPSAPVAAPNKGG